MYRVIDKRGTGKTRQLLEEAKANNGLVVCEHPEAMRQKAMAYGLGVINCMSYADYYSDIFQKYKTVYIDELEKFLLAFDTRISGYTLTNED